MRVGTYLSFVEADNLDGAKEVANNFIGEKIERIKKLRGFENMTCEVDDAYLGLDELDYDVHFLITVPNAEDEDKTVDVLERELNLLCNLLDG